MESQLEERHLNSSLDAKPACTDRNYIAGASGRYEDDTRNGHLWRGSTDANNSSPFLSAYDYSPTQVPIMYGSPASPSHSATTSSTTHHGASREPLQPISNLFAEPTFDLPQKTSDSFRKSIPSPSITVHLSEQENSRDQWIQPPCSANRSSSSPRRLGHRFPMHLTPIKAANKRNAQEHQAAHRPPSSSGRTLRHGHDRPEVVVKRSNRFSHPKSSYPPSFSHPSVSPPHTSPFANEFTNLNPRQNCEQGTREQETHQQDLLPTSSIYRSSHHSFDETPPQPVAQPCNIQGLMRRPFGPQQLEAFSTPRPMREHMTQTPLQGPAPFSTPRPVRSVLGRFKRAQQGIGVRGLGTSG